MEPPTIAEPAIITGCVCVRVRVFGVRFVRAGRERGESFFSASSHLLPYLISQDRKRLTSQHLHDAHPSVNLPQRRRGHRERQRWVRQEQWQQCHLRPGQADPVA